VNGAGCCSFGIVKERVVSFGDRDRDRDMMIVILE